MTRIELSSTVELLAMLDDPEISEEVQEAAENELELRDYDLSDPRVYDRHNSL